MTNNNELTTKEKARIMKNAYQREWAKKNRDKVRASVERHYAKKYDEMMINKIYDDFADGRERGDISG